MRHNLVYTVEQVTVQERFFNDGDAGVGGARSQGQAWMSGNENCRHRDFPIAEFCDEINPAYPGQLLVDDETTAARKCGFVQQLFSARVGANDKPFDLQGKFERFANSGIIIDNNDEAGLNRQVSLFFHRSRYLPTQPIGRH
jgi:hypothetical protein